MQISSYSKLLMCGAFLGTLPFVQPLSTAQAPDAQQELAELKAKREALLEELARVEQQIAEREPNKLVHLPAPLESIVFDGKLLERDNMFSVVSVSYGTVGQGDITADGIAWKLKAKKDMTACDAEVTLKRFSHPGFRFVTVDNEVVGTGMLSLPDKIIVGCVLGEKIESSDTVTVWMFLNRQKVRDLLAQKAIKMVPIRL